MSTDPKVLKRQCLVDDNVGSQSATKGKRTGITKPTSPPSPPHRKPADPPHLPAPPSSTGPVVSPTTAPRPCPNNPPLPKKRPRTLTDPDLEPKRRQPQSPELTPIDLDLAATVAESLATFAADPLRLDDSYFANVGHDRSWLRNTGVADDIPLPTPPPAPLSSPIIVPDGHEDDIVTPAHQDPQPASDIHPPDNLFTVVTAPETYSGIIGEDLWNDVSSLNDQMESRTGQPCLELPAPHFVPRSKDFTVDPLQSQLPETFPRAQTSVLSFREIQKHEGPTLD